MEQFNQVILSIGSNQGDRLKHLQDCVDRLKMVFEKIKAVSFVYETPAWGFESEPFYNAAIWIKTKNSALEILKKSQVIEVDLGKIKHDDFSTYHARLIDVDIICIDNQVIDLPTLQIPHPHLQDRNFVLQPIAEFDLQWEHPLLKKTIKQLILDCSDQSECERIDQKLIF